VHAVGDSVLVRRGNSVAAELLRNGRMARNTYIVIGVRVSVTAGSVFVTAGSVSVTAGRVTVTAGRVFVTAGSVSVPPGASW